MNKDHQETPVSSERYSGKAVASRMHSEDNVINFAFGRNTANATDIAHLENCADRLLTHGPELTASVISHLRASRVLVSISKLEGPEIECLLMSLVSLVVSELRHPYRLMPCLHGLARTYLGKNGTVADLRCVRDAITYGIRRCLGREFAPAAQQAWLRVSEMLISEILMYTPGEQQPPLAG